MEHRKFTEKETKALEQIDGHLDECAKLLQEVEPDIFDTVPLPNDALAHIQVVACELIKCRFALNKTLTPPEQVH